MTTQCWGHSVRPAATGKVRVNGVEVGARDGAVITGDEAVRIEALEPSEILLADLP